MVPAAEVSANCWTPQVPPVATEADVGATDPWLPRVVVDAEPTVGESGYVAHLAWLVVIPAAEFDDDRQLVPPIVSESNWVPLPNVLIPEIWPEKPAPQPTSDPLRRATTPSRINEPTTGLTQGCPWVSPLRVRFI